MSYWTTFFFVSLVVCIADICWTMYMIETEKRRPWHAGIWSSLIMLAGAFTTVNYVNDKSFVIAAAIGAFIGTSGIIIWKKRQESM